MGGLKMQYRKFGKFSWKASALGFGCMRLPQVDQDMSHLDEEESVRIIRYGIDNGINYVDTAAPYAMGNSEKVVGKALRDGYRQKVRLATKLTPFFIKSPGEFQGFFEGQLERLQTDKIDLYMLHGMNKKCWEMFKEWKAIDFIEGLMAKGLVDHIGFSFHDEFPVFKEIIDYYDGWDFCQIQYNYMDINRQAGIKGLRYAAEKGLAVVIMEALRGGLLTKRPPDSVSKIWDTAPVKRSQAAWGLLWLWNQPEVSVVLSGMSNMQQVVENLSVAGDSCVGILGIEEQGIIEKVRDAYIGLTPVSCTGCGYCMPCPNNVEIPAVFDMYNECTMYDDFRGGIMRYMGGIMGIEENQRASSCIECGECMEKCPQQISIPENLKKAHEKLYDPNFKFPF
jgi:predicted aldo/keto reductase-like oxidoreductase